MAEEEEWVEVTIRHSIERLSEIHLEDGTILIYKAPALRVWRHKSQYNHEGNPLYHLQTGQIAAEASSVPGDLKKKE